MRRVIPTALLLALALAPSAFSGTATVGTQATGVALIGSSARWRGRL